MEPAAFLRKWKNKARSSRTEKDRARASVDVQSSQKTVPQRLPHFSALPQSNSLRSIPFLYLYFLGRKVGRCSPKSFGKGKHNYEYGVEFSQLGRNAGVSPASQCWRNIKKPQKVEWSPNLVMTQKTTASVRCVNGRLFSKVKQSRVAW